MPDPSIPSRPALAVKVDNVAAALPQVGLEEADVVYEEPVEGGLTRLVAIFQSRLPDRVGPVRSARTTEDMILPEYRAALVFAGAVPEVVAGLRRSGVVLFTDSTNPRAFRRDPGRVAPHNLFVSLAELAEEARGLPPPSPGPLRFRRGDVEGLSSGLSAGAEASPSRAGWSGPAWRPLRRLLLRFSEAASALWEYDEATGEYLRSQGGRELLPHVSASGKRLGAANVVVQFVRVRPGRAVDVLGNPSPEVDLVGAGRALVLTGGEVLEATWEKASRISPTRITAGGESILLSPGVTWWEIFPQGGPVEEG